MARLKVSGSVLVEWRNHKAYWKRCKACPLHKGRSSVVLVRGYLPADVFFIGEAPGDSEDSLGYPFVGPAGQKIDEILREAIGMAYGRPAGCSLESFMVAGGVRYAFTNILACIPRQSSDRSGGIRKPSRVEAKECRSRLLELIKIASPRLIITLGKIPQSLLPVDSLPDIPIENMLHPAAIIRTFDTSPPRANLQYKRCVASLAEWLRRMEE